MATSFYPLYFFASTIGGDKAQVFNITPADAEPHDYEPTTQEIARISDSDMLVLNGGALEAWGDKIKQQLQGTHVLVVTVGEGLATKDLTEDGQTIQDPHIWLDPVLAKQVVERIEKGFETIDPNNRAYFQANAASLIANLDKLHMAYQQGLAHCAQKDFVTSHAAFGYLAARYGIYQVAISGVSPDQEPSPQTLAQIAQLVRQKHIGVIFFESLVSPKLSQTIATETGAKTLVLDPLEGIHQTQIKAGQNYFTIMQTNLNNLNVALQCSP